AMGNSPPEALQPRTDGHRAEPLHRDADRLAAILATQREIATARLDLDAVMRLVAERTRALTDAPGAAVELVEGGQVGGRAATGRAAHALGLRLPVGSSLSGLCVRTGQALRCDDAETDGRVDRRACRQVGARSLIVAPLHSARRAVGVLKVLSPQAQAF